MINNSKRTIFPESDNYPETDLEDTLYFQSTYQLQPILTSIPTNTLLQTAESTQPNQSDRLSVEQLQLTLKQISSQYDRGQLKDVKETCCRILQKLSKMSAQEEFINMYKHSFQRWLGMAYLKQLQSSTHSDQITNKLQLVAKAKECLQYHQPAQSLHKKAKRLNNLGLCELFLNQNANSFQCFTKALKIYEQDKGLNILGLLKNIAQLYLQWEMYNEAVKIYNQIRTINYLSERQQYNVILRMLQCSNLSPNDPNRKDNFHRARTLLQKEDSLCLYFNLKLRFELILYSIKWGITDGDITVCKVHNLIKTVESYKPQKPKLRYLQAYCYYIYREVYAGEDWRRYKEYSQYASEIFKEIYQK